MISFQIDDMTCGHCVGAITKALRAVDAVAKVQFDLATHRVDIEAVEAQADQLRDAIREAGYTTVQIESTTSGATLNAASARKGCCCG
jgi:copper chaperone